MTDANVFRCWAATAPGLEAIADDELRRLGVAKRAPEPGGVEFEATALDVFHANLHLRSVTRVLVRIAEFHATSFHELERRARRVPWGAFVPDFAKVAVRVTCKKSRLYHSLAVKERLVDALLRGVPGAVVEPPNEDDDAEGGASQLFLVRLSNDVCTISADSSGALLHRRGYRLSTAKAPLRETLAAAALLALGYDGSTPLLDPMCGSGTFAIEGALIARRIPPGLTRTFSCERWPSAPTTALDGARDRARQTILPRAPAPIVASDRDAGAIRAATANATRAKVDGDIALAARPLSALGPSRTNGLFVVNPPYGERIGERAALRNLYAEIGNTARAQCAGWTFAMVAESRELERQLKLPLETVLRFPNGGIPVRLVRGVVPSHPRE